MTEASSSDRHYQDGAWVPMRDILADLADGVVDEMLESVGWTPFMRLGSRDSRLCVESWHNRSTDEYLAAISDEVQLSSFVKVDSLPELMDLFARWGPAVQASAISGLIEDLRGPALIEGGIVEMVAARAAYGVESELPRLRREAQERRPPLRMKVPTDGR